MGKMRVTMYVRLLALVVVEPVEEISLQYFQKFSSMQIPKHSQFTPFMYITYLLSRPHCFWWAHIFLRHFQRLGPRMELCNCYSAFTSYIKLFILRSFKFPCSCNKWERLHVPFTKFFPNGNTLQNCNTISQPTYWYWQSRYTFPSP